MDNDGLFRDRTVYCLSCAAGLARVGDRLQCESCGGAQVADGALITMFGEIAHDDERGLSARLVAATSPSRRCPCCVTDMTAHVLYDTLVDRCATHGVWFDAGELEQVLVACGNAARARRQLGGNVVRSAFVLGIHGLCLAPLIGALVAIPAGVAVAALTIGAVRRRRARRAVRP
jgi:hypothetical protein